MVAAPEVGDSPAVDPVTIAAPTAEGTSQRNDDSYVPGGPTVPSMITVGEAEFFRECARGPLAAGGSIVDLGCFMGSTAIALARGVMEAGRRDEVIAYDLFTWADWMHGMPTHGVYHSGDCFLPEARRYARDLGGGLISVYRADLSTFEWDGRPISLLLVDAMKSFEVAGQIVRSFYPALLPGAVLLHQDFKHYWTGWIHIVQHRFRDRFRFHRSIPEAGTVAFTVTRAIDPEEALARSDLGSISDEEIDEAFRFSLGLIPPDEATNVAAAHVMIFHHLGRLDQAITQLMKYRALSFDQSGEFPGMLHEFFPGVDRSARVA
jgi:hypothetical protein